MTANLVTNWMKKLLSDVSRRERRRWARSTNRSAPQWRPLVELLEDRVTPNTYTVNDLADAAGTASDVTLRYAVNNAQNGDTINFSVTGTIHLASPLTVATNVTITGAGAPGPVAVSGLPAQGLFGTYFHLTAATDLIQPAAVSNSAWLGNQTPSASSTLVGSIDFPSVAYGGGFVDTQGNSYYTSVAAGQNNDNVEGRWYGDILIPGPIGGAAVSINFATTSDDGSMLYVDGAAVVNNNFFQGATQRTGMVNLTPGLHTIDVEYYQGGGGASMVASWDPTGGTNFVPIPNSAFYLSGTHVQDFIVSSGVTASISNLTIENGAGTSGGGVHNAGTLTLANDTITGNSALAGAGVFNATTGKLTVSASTITGNSVAPVTGVTGSGDAGGIGNEGAATVVNSTIANNTAQTAGGIGSTGSLNLSNDTIAYNTVSGAAGGLGNQGAASLQDTIVASNTDASGPDDIYNIGTISANYTLVGNSTNSGITGGTGNQLNVSPGLAATLANNGGPTQTLALLSGSAAINNGGPITTASSASASATMITVANAAAIASTPGNYYITIGSEELLVTNVNTSTNTLTVTRGVNGTTAAAISSGAAVFQGTDQRGGPTPSPQAIGAFQAFTPTVTQNTANLADSSGSITITGTNFSPVLALDSVAFNLGVTGTVASATANQLVITITGAPNALGALTAVVTSSGVSSGAAVQVATYVNGNWLVTDPRGFGGSPADLTLPYAVAHALSTDTIDFASALSGLTITSLSTLAITTNITISNPLAPGLKIAAATYQAGLIGTYFNIAATQSLIQPATASNPNWLGNQTPAQPASPLVGPIDFPNISGNGFIDPLGNQYYNPFPGANNNVEARWYGEIIIPGTGSTPVPVRFGTSSDDGSMLYIDGNAVVNNNFFQGVTQRTGLVNLIPGLHAIDVEYYQGGGGAAMFAQWNPTGGSTVNVDIPNSAFLQPGTPTQVFSIASGVSASISNVTIENGAAASGAGVNNAGTLTLAYDTITGNTATVKGGGVYNSGALTIINSTIAFNTATSSGGGVYNATGAHLTLSNDTLAYNSAGVNGGGLGTAGTALVRDIIATGDTGPGTDVNGTLTAAANNVIGGSNVVATALANNGGPTQTLLLLNGSAAIGTGGALMSLTTAISSATATTIQVPNATWIAQTPGSYDILIDSEQLQVTSVNTSTNTLTVVRGVNGTTAATHAVGAGVFVGTDQRGSAVPSPQDIGAFQTFTPVVTANPSNPIADSSATVTINGMHFSTVPAADSVTFNLGVTGTVTAATATQLIVTINTPPTALGNLTAVVGTGGPTSGAPVVVATYINGTWTVNNTAGVGGSLSILTLPYAVANSLSGDNINFSLPAFSTITASGTLTLHNNVPISNNVLGLKVTAATYTQGLTGTYFNIAAATNLIQPASPTNGPWLGNQTPLVTATLVGPIDFPNIAANGFADSIGTAAYYNDMANNNNTEARWFGDIIIPGTGTTPVPVNFRTGSDDGSMIYIDGNVVVNNNFFQGVTYRSGLVDLTPGLHSIDIEYYNGGGGAGMFAQWDPTGGTNWADIPNSAFLIPTAVQVFNIPSGVATSVSNLTIENGVGATGGGVHNAGTLTLANDTISGNSAATGGGIYNTGTLTLYDSTVNNNTASGNGGGIYNSGTMTIGNDTVANNKASATTGSGGGVYNSASGTLTLSNDTIAYNGAFAGGGLAANGTVTMKNSIVSNNTFQPGLTGTYFNLTAAGNLIQPATASNTSWLGNQTPAVTTPLLGPIDFPNIAYGGGFVDTQGHSYYTYGGNQNNVEGRWYGEILIPGSGTTAVPVRFATTSDDGSVLYIDGNLVVNNNFFQGATQRSGLASLTPGLHAIDVEYYQGGGGASMVASWDPTGGTNFAPIPNSVFFYPEAPTDLTGTLTSASGSNLIGGNTGIASGLANNGGPTQTISLLVGSPAIGTAGNLTSLTAAVTSTTAATIQVQNAALIAATPGNFYIKVDQEEMLVTNVTGNTLTVVRGVNGTTAATHASGASVNLGTDQRGITRLTPTSIGALEDPLWIVTDDNGAAGSGSFSDVTLPFAMNELNNGVGIPTIEFAPTLTGANGNTIILSSTLNFTASYSINGAGATNLTISGNHALPVFNIPSGVTSTISNMTITNGLGANGGGVDNAGTLTLSNDTLTGNAATNGGGVYNSGTLTFTDSTATGNTATGTGSGIDNTGKVTISSSGATPTTINDNIATQGIAGITLNGTGTIAIGGNINLTNGNLTDSSTGQDTISGVISGTNTTGTASFPGLIGQYFNISASAARIYPATATNASWLGNQTPAVTAPLVGPIDFPNIATNGFADSVGDPAYYNLGNGNNNNVEGRWYGEILIPGSGTTPVPINFATASDDGSVLYIDGALVVNNNFFQGVTQRTGLVNLTPGLHAIDVEYYNGGGGAAMDTMWDPTGNTNFVDIPSSALFSVQSTNGVNKTGSGSLTLSNTNTYIGPTNIAAGTLVATVNGAMGPATDPGIVVSSGGALAFSGTAVNYTNAEPLTINGSGPAGNGAIESMSGTNTFAGPITLSGNATIGADAGTLNLTYNGVLNMTAYSLTTTGAGNINIPSDVNGSFTSPIALAPNNYVGFTGGTGGLNSVQEIENWNYTSGTTSLSYSNTAMNWNTLTLNGGASVDPTTNNLELCQGANNEARTAWTPTTVPIANFDTTFQFTFAGTGGNPADGITFAIQDDSNTVVGGGGGGLGYSGIPGNSLALEFNLYTGSGTGSGSDFGVGFNGAITHNINLVPDGVNFSANPSDTYQATAVLSGTLLTVSIWDTTLNAITNPPNFTETFGVPTVNNLTKNGTGTLTLSDTNTYSGSTTINAGILKATANSALGSAPAGTSITVASGAALALSSVNYTTVEPISIAGAGPTGNGAIEGITGANTFVGPITLTGNTTIGADAGTLNLTNSAFNMATYNLTTVGAGNINIPSNISGTAVAPPTTGFVGFTGGTGGLASTQNILNWTYTDGSTNINYGTGFTTNNLSLNGGATIQGSDLQLTDGNTGEARTAWNPTAVPVTSYTTTFEWNYGTTAPAADGFTFAVQNDGNTAVGAGGGGLGYGGLAGNSYALQFNTYTGSGTGSGSDFGLGINGAISHNINLVPSGINFQQNPDDTYMCTATLSGNALTVTIEDTTIGASTTYTTTFYLPTPTTSYVGFTGGTGGLNAVQTINNWTYTSGATNINNSSGFTGSNLTLNGGATITGTGGLELTDGNNGEARTAWTPTPVSINGFNTTFQWTFAGTGGNPADGFTFAVQNASNTVVGAGGGGLGYNGIPGNSFAVEFNLYTGSGTGSGSDFGVGLNGAVNHGINLIPYGINFSANVNDVYQATLVDNGNGGLTVSLWDTTTNAITNPPNYTGTFTIPAITGTNSVTVDGTGTPTSGKVTLGGTNTYSGATTANAGILEVDGSIAASSSATVNTTSTLDGIGLVPAVQVNSGGSIKAGDAPGTITAASLTMTSGSNFNEELGGTTAGTQYDQTIVLAGGSVALGGATLNLSFVNGFTPTTGESFTIIHNETGTAVSGTFAQGSTITFNGVTFSINYAGNTDGVDVVLTVMSALATPTIATTQQPASATVGAGIADQATVSGGNSPTGTVTFNLYSNSTGTGTPLVTDANVPLVSGVATSPSYTTLATGTVYWVATYNGNTNNNPVTSGLAAEPVVISAATPTIATTQQPATVTVGGTIADQATVSGGFSPGGTVTFNLYSSATTQNSSTLLFTSANVALVGGVATSASFTTTATGTDYWVATYNGNSNNNSVSSGAAAEPVVINSAVTTFQVTSTTLLSGDNGFLLTFSAPYKLNSGTTGFNLYTGDSGHALNTNRAVQITGPGGASFGVTGTNDNVKFNAVQVTPTEMELIETGVTHTVAPPLLASGTWNITLLGGTNNPGIQQLSNSADLDGNGDGTVQASDNYTTTVAATAPSSSTAVVTIGDLVAGPGQTLTAPLVLSGGIVNEVTSVDLTIVTSTSAYTVTGFTVNSATGATAAFSATTGILTMSSSTPFSTSNNPLLLGTFTFTVPTVASGTAPGIDTKTPITISNTTVGALISGSFQQVPSIGVSSFNVTGYIGDVAGPFGVYNATDVSQIQGLIVGALKAFVGYPNVDPVLLADVNHDGVVNATDVSQLQGRIIGSPQSNIPALPAGSSGATINGADPVLFVGTSFTPDGQPANLGNLTPGSTVLVPLSVFVTDPKGVNVTGAEAAFSFDPKVFSLNGVSAGAIASGSLGGSAFAIDFAEVAPGELNVIGSSTFGPNLAYGQTATLFLVSLTVREDAPTGGTLFNLLSSEGGYQTGLQDNQGRNLVLSPAPQNSLGNNLDGAFTIQNGKAMQQSALGLVPTTTTGGKAGSVTALTPAAWEQLTTQLFQAAANQPVLNVSNGGLVAAAAVPGTDTTEGKKLTSLQGATWEQLTTNLFQTAAHETDLNGNPTTL